MNMPDGHFEQPSVARRMACMLYETLLLAGVVFAAGFLFGILTQTRNALDNRDGLQVFLFFVIGAYFVWFWSKGQTLAMKTWHLHIRLANGGVRIPAQRALIRYLLAWFWIIPPLGLASILQPSLPGTLALVIAWFFLWSMPSRLRHDRQLMHDVWAGTQLVYIKPAPDTTVRKN